MSSRAKDVLVFTAAALITLAATITATVTVIHAEHPAVTVRQSSCQVT